jgi:phenylalanyl-tRNA synthetase beta chain
MFISHNWLRELTGTKLSPDDVRDRLTNVGLAVDAVEERGDDFVLDVEVPSNRGDCLSHVGIAREIAVIENSQVQTPESKVQSTKGTTGDFASVEIVDPDLCPRYAARIVRGVKIGPSPEWLTRKLESIGQRPINNVADITNYVLHEFGQPLHAFDLAKLTESKIIVRRARKGESIKTLDGVDRKLDDQMLVIADAQEAVAVAGVMGGEFSEISDTTTDVLIESAYFNAPSVRRTSKLLGLHTEASHRFERGTDPDGVLAAQERCTALICELAGGVATEDALDAYPKPLPIKSVTLRPARIEAVTSLRVDHAEVKRILAALGFALTDEGSEALAKGRLNPSADADGTDLSYIVPSWRHDVLIEEDLIEEVARHAGYDQIGSELPPATAAGELHPAEGRKRALRRSLAQSGYDEAIDFSFIETTNEFELIPELANASEPVVLVNPIIEEASRMRPTLLPGLLSSIRHNLNQGTRDLCLFETGRVFAGSAGGELPREREALALAMTGGRLEANRAQPVGEQDFFDLKGALEAAVDAMNLPPLSFASATVKHLRPGQSAAIHIQGIRIGSIGRLAESLAGEYKFRQPVFVAELDLTSLLEHPEQAVLYSRLPRFPSIVRDVSLLVDRSTTVAELISAARADAGRNVVDVAFVGTYEGEGVGEGKRSVTLRFEYRADDHTLRDEEVDALHWPIVEALKKTYNAEIR